MPSRNKINLNLFEAHPAVAPSEVVIQANGNGRGDWVRVLLDGELFCEGHTISIHDVCDLLTELNHTVTKNLELTDAEFS